MSYPTQISVSEALRVLAERAPRLGAETVPLSAALGRVLARDLKSLVDHPSCDNSALDGYACREADTRAATAAAPVSLRVVGEVPAGSHFAGRVGPGEATSIYTGAPLPEGADAIVGVEFADEVAGHVKLRRPASPRDIRPRAQDVRAGETVLRAGARLSPVAVGTAALMGHAEVPVVRRARVGVLATGDEVIEPGQPLRDGEVYNSNAYALSALLTQAGAEVVRLPNVRDDVGVLGERLRAQGLDLLLTSGGVSMGRYDFVRDLLFEGGAVHFWKVAMKPGGPALFGTFEGLPVLGLPGNPVSSLVVFELLGRAWLAAATGDTAPLPYHTRITATAESAFKGSGFKETFARATLHFGSDGAAVRSAGSQSSGVLTALLRANALALVPPHTDVAVGERLEVIPL